MQVLMATIPMIQLHACERNIRVDAGLCDSVYWLVEDTPCQYIVRLCAFKMQYMTLAFTLVVYDRISNMRFACDRHTCSDIIPPKHSDIKSLIQLVRDAFKERERCIRFIYQATCTGMKNIRESILRTMILQLQI